MQVEMKYKKSTKNTYVFESDVIPSLYIPKSEFEKQPMTISVTVKVLENDFQ